MTKSVEERIAIANKHIAAAEQDLGRKLTHDEEADIIRATYTPAELADEQAWEERLAKGLPQGEDWWEDIPADEDEDNYTNDIREGWRLE